MRKLRHVLHVTRWKRRSARLDEHVGSDEEEYHSERWKDDLKRTCKDNNELNFQDKIIQIPYSFDLLLQLHILLPQLLLLFASQFFAVGSS